MYQKVSVTLSAAAAICHAVFCHAAMLSYVMPYAFVLYVLYGTFGDPLSKWCGKYQEALGPLSFMPKCTMVQAVWVGTTSSVVYQMYHGKG